MTDIDRGIEAPVYEQIAATIRGRIEAGTYPPGRQIPSTAALAAEFGVAQLTVRSALRLLAAEGLTRTIPRRGTYVRASDEPPPVRRLPGQAALSLAVAILATAAVLYCSMAPGHQAPAPARPAVLVEQLADADQQLAQYRQRFRPACPRPAARASGLPA